MNISLQICNHNGSFVYENPTYVWNDEHKAPYMFEDRVWTGGDDVRSLTLKVGNKI